MKVKVLIAKQVPEFPDIEWNNVLAGKSVNLDIIFTRMYSTTTDSRNIENLGEGPINQPNQSKFMNHLQTTKFVFLHHKRKLSLDFASLHSSAHWKVFKLDKTI